MSPTETPHEALRRLAALMSSVEYGGTGEIITNSIAAIDAQHRAEMERITAENETLRSESLRKQGMLDEAWGVNSDQTEDIQRLQVVVAAMQTERDSAKTLIDSLRAEVVEKDKTLTHSAHVMRVGMEQPIRDIAERVGVAYNDDNLIETLEGIRSILNMRWQDAGSQHKQIIDAEGDRDAIDEEARSLVIELLSLLGLRGYNGYADDLGKLSLAIIARTRDVMQSRDRELIDRPFGIKPDKLETIRLGLADARVWMSGFKAALGKDEDDREPECLWAIREVLRLISARLNDRDAGEEISF